MRLSVDVEGDRKLIKNLDKIQRRQLPFATSVAINAMEKPVRRELTRHTRAVFDRPRPYMTGRGAYWWNRAQKRNLTATIKPSDAIADVVAAQTFGGNIRRGGVVPLDNTSVRLNRYGDTLRTTQLRTWSRRKDTFWRRVSGSLGLFGRDPAGGLRLLFWVPRGDSQYDARFDYFGTIERTVRANYQREFQKGLRKALRTAN